MDTPLTQLESEDYQPRTVGKRTQAQAAPVDRMLVGDITYIGNGTPSRPAGKTRLTSNSPASAVAIAGDVLSVARAIRHFQLLQMAKEVEAARLGDGHPESTQSEPVTPVEHRDSDQGPPVPPTYLVYACVALGSNGCLPVCSSSIS